MTPDSSCFLNSSVRSEHVVLTPVAHRGETEKLCVTEAPGINDEKPHDNLYGYLLHGRVWVDLTDL